MSGPGFLLPHHSKFDPPRDWTGDGYVDPASSIEAERARNEEPDDGDVPA